MAETGASLSVTPDQRSDESLRPLSVLVPDATAWELLDSAPDGLVMVDEQGRILLVNRRIEEMFGYPRGDLVGKPVERLLPERVRAIHRKHRTSYVEQPRVRPMGVGLSLLGRRQDGTEFPVEVSLSPLSTSVGSWIVAAVRDSSQREVLAQQRHATAVAHEDIRIAEQLADRVIYGLFGVGLRLQGLLGQADQRIQPELDAAVADIDRTIREIREVIFGLAGAQGPSGTG